MAGPKLSEESILAFRDNLILEEKSTYTTEKYLRDVCAFFRFAGEKPVTKELVMDYKKSFGGSGLRCLLRQLHAGICQQSAVFSGLGRLQGKKSSGSAADLLCGGKGAEQSGIYAAFGGVREEHTAQHCTANHLRHRHPGFRTALFYGGSSAAWQDYSKL